MVDAPKLFSRKLQNIFEYIWDNPNATSVEIEEVFWQNVSSNVLSVCLGHIRRGLTNTEYQLVDKPSGQHSNRTVTRSGRTLLSYKIINRRPKPSEGTEHGTV